MKYILLRGLEAPIELVNYMNFTSCLWSPTWTISPVKAFITLITAVFPAMHNNGEPLSAFAQATLQLSADGWSFISTCTSRSNLVFYTYFLVDYSLNDLHLSVFHMSWPADQQLHMIYVKDNPPQKSACTSTVGELTCFPPTAAKIGSSVGPAYG